MASMPSPQAGVQVVFSRRSLGLVKLRGGTEGSRGSISVKQRWSAGRIVGVWFSGMVTVGLYGPGQPTLQRIDPGISVLHRKMFFLGTQKLTVDAEDSMELLKFTNSPGVSASAGIGREYVIKLCRADVLPTFFGQGAPMGTFSLAVGARVRQNCILNTRNTSDQPLDCADDSEQRSNIAEEEEKNKSSREASASWARKAGAGNPLTPEEEFQLTSDVQALLHLQREKDKLEIELGRMPTIQEWAEHVGSSVFRLYARIGKGRAAKRKMVAANLPLVSSVAGQFEGRGLSHWELCQEGVLGLLKSTEKYNVSYKTKFSTYSFWWIWEGMSAAVKKFRHVLRISRTVYGTASVLLRHKEEFQASNGREPTLQELAGISRVEVDMIRSTLRLLKPVKSMEGAVSTLDGEYERQVADPNIGRLPWIHMRETELKMDVCKALESLTAREQQVLQMRYGLVGKPPQSRAEVASALALSYETIRLTEKKALDKLRHSGKEDGLQQYLSKGLWDQ